MSAKADHRATLTKHRAEIERLQNELADLDDAPLPKADWKARVDDWITAAAARARDNAAFAISALRSPSQRDLDPPRLPGDIFTLRDVPDELGLRALAGADLAPVLAWLFPDQLRDRLHAAIDALEYDAGPALADRPERKRKLEERLMAAEINEEQAVRKLEEATEATEPRRADARPELVLAWDDELKTKGARHA